MAMKARNVTIGSHRGNARLWLEGLWLVEAGFRRGSAYRVQSSTVDKLVLVADAKGDRTISGKTKGGKDVAIIDINDSAIVQLPIGDAFATIGDGRIVIRSGRVENK